MIFPVYFQPQTDGFFGLFVRATFSWHMNNIPESNLKDKLYLQDEIRPWLLPPSFLACSLTHLSSSFPAAPLAKIFASQLRTTLFISALISKLFLSRNYARVLSQVPEYPASCPIFLNSFPLYHVTHLHTVGILQNLNPGRELGGLSSAVTSAFRKLRQMDLDKLKVRVRSTKTRLPQNKAK